MVRIELSYSSYRCSLQNFSYNFEDAWFCSDKYNVLKNFDIYNTLPVSTLVTVTNLRRKPRFCQLPSTATARSFFPSFSSTASRTALPYCVHRFLLLPAVKCGLYFENFVGGGEDSFMDTAKHLADSAPLPMHRT
ncbi:hypothetical protein TNCV_2053941 [Trichonephila clavipes]|nr:hypothetical protein TNCV_2053941 [Trichonephila clavipes]